MRRLAAACLALVLSFGIATQAHSTSTLAWSKVFDVGGSDIMAQCSDLFGDVTYGFTDGGKLVVTKVDPYGAQLWTNSTFLFSPFRLYFLAADNMGNTYALGVFSSVSPQTAEILKYGPDGSPLWSALVNGGSDLFPLTLKADSGGAKAAFATSGLAGLYAVWSDPNGAFPLAIVDNAISPNSAKFCIDGNLLVTGGASSGAVCKLYPASAQPVLSFQSDSLTADSDQRDDVYIAANSVAGSSFELLKFDAQGKLQWTSNPSTGAIDNIASGVFDRIFVHNRTSGQLEFFDPDIVAFPAMGPPNPVFTKALAVDRLISDPVGGVFTQTGNVFRYYDPTGQLTWAQTFTVANTVQPNIQSVSAPAVLGSQLGPDPLVFSGESLISGSSYALFVGKYVSDAAVLQLTLSPTYVTGGAPVVGTVKLSATAGMGGGSVALSSSSPALANPPATMTVPQGSAMGTFSASTPPVDVAEAVTLSATGGGARRSAVVNVIPATIFSVTTPLSMVKGGTHVTGTLNLTGRAGPSGRSVALSSSNSAAATVPPGVNVAPYASSVNFVVATHPVSANTAVTFTARSGTVTKTATLTVTP